MEPNKIETPFIWERVTNLRNNIEIKWKDWEQMRINQSGNLKKKTVR